MNSLTKLIASTLSFCWTLSVATNLTIAADQNAILQQINLKPGFAISIFATMPSPRQIEVDSATGLIFIGSRHGHVFSMTDKDNDGVADEIHQLAKGLNVPNGVAVRDGKLFIALNDKIATWNIPTEINSDTTIRYLNDVKIGPSNGFMHGWRVFDFGPDGKLYVTIGAPCNICELNENTGKIFRMDPDGTNWGIVADGVRNSVGFDWHPKTGELWFTDNGADGMGDNIPPDELNRVTHAGQHFGFPYMGGKSNKLSGYKNQTPPMTVTPPEIEFQAHTANLGIDFYTGDMFPAEYKNDAFVVQHGSWNRSKPVGYRIMRIRFDRAGNAKSKEVFADGWLSDNGVIGRPVDIEELHDGSLLVSDDYAGIIYRISYENKP